MKKKRLLMGWLCCLLACVGVAQTPISFTSDQGLSNTCIHSILQDSYKNVWICTQNGLNRYDGAKMNVYYHSDDDAGSLQHNNVLCVLELQPGTVLVGTEAGVQAYSYDTDGFTLLPLLAENGDTLRAHVISMTRLSDGTVYVCTSGYGCYRLHTVDGGGMEMRQTSEFPVKDQLTQLMEDRRHRLAKAAPARQMSGDVPLQQEGCPRRRVKNGHVHPHHVEAQGPGVPVVKQGDQQQSRQGPRQPRRPGPPAPPAKGGGRQGRQQQRHEQQLHVLPGGLVHRRKCPHHGVLSAPAVGEVEQRPGGGGKEESPQPPHPASSVHTLPPPRTGVRAFGESICPAAALYAPPPGRRH